MPYTAKQRAFFNVCAHDPKRARGKCPKPADSKRLAHEANTKPLKRPKKRK